MNYQKIHDHIIQRARQRQTSDCYTERHHIIPKCMKGKDEPDNLVDLTAKEHFIIHKLLCEIYPEERGLRHALWNMVNGWKGNTHKRNYKISSKEYERLRQDFSKNISEVNSGKNNGMYGISLSGSLSPNYNKTGSLNNNYGNYWSDSQKERQSEKVKKWWEDSNKEKIKERNRRLSEALKGKYTGKNHPKSKAVRCLQENCCGNKLFNTGTECSNYHDVVPSVVSSHCNKNTLIQKFKFEN